jgi:hypothetical protein
MQEHKSSSKKTLPEAVELAKMLYDEVELWTMDEHRIGLKPILRRVWAPIGQRPVISTYPRYEWLYLYAFIQPETGQSIWYILPELSTKAFQAVLDNFACAVNVSKNHILLVLDNAAWHTSSKLVLPDSIQTVFQPAYSPELQPAEHLWQLSDELIANRSPKDLDDLQQRLVTQCERLIQDPERVKSHTLFHWWPRVY